MSYDDTDTELDDDIDILSPGDYDYDPDQDEVGICMGCGAEMDYSPYHPWCADCDDENEEEPRGWA